MSRALGAVPAGRDARRPGAHHRAARLARARARRYRQLAEQFAPPPAGTPRRRRAYTRLFVAPRPRVYPYESLHRDEPPRVMGEHTQQVLRWYRDAGFAPPPDWRDLPDHIALELRFMAALADAEADRWEDGEVASARALIERERGFVEAHLLPWVPAFCAAVLEATPRGRLRQAARTLQAWIPRDHDWLLALTAAA